MAPNLEHRCLGTERGLPLDKAELTDQQRLGLLLEGCALLACLKLAGERPRVDWSGVRVTASGRLVRARRRSSSSAPMLQSSFCDLLARLFGIGGGGGEVDAEAAEDLRIAGPGVGRRSARRLLTLWRQRVEPVSIDRSLEEIFCAAASSPVIRTQHLPLPAVAATPRRSLYHESIDAYRRSLVREALEGTRGHRASAARQLGITRQALSYLLRRLEIA